MIGVIACVEWGLENISLTLLSLIKVPSFGQAGLSELKNKSNT